MKPSNPTKTFRRERTTPLLVFCVLWENIQNSPNTKNRKKQQGKPRVYPDWKPSPVNSNGQQLQKAELLSPRGSSPTALRRLPHVPAVRRQRVPHADGMLAAPVGCACALPTGCEGLRGLPLIFDCGGQVSPLLRSVTRRAGVPFRDRQPHP